jgi:GNAT superfamily N-acetyltransferase
MIDPLVRMARRADGAELVELQRSFRDAAAPMRGGERWLAENPPIDDWGAAIGAGEVVVAHLDDLVVGYLVARLGTDAILRVGEVWVVDEARELGFGDAMLELAITAGRDRGARGVEGQALPGDRATKNLYERAGIVARLIITYRDLTGDDVSDPASSEDASR